MGGLILRCCSVVGRTLPCSYIRRVKPGLQKCIFDLELKLQADGITKMLLELRL